MVSVVIPAKNRANSLRKAVDSVYADTSWPKIEVIVVDGASRDASSEVLIDYAARYGNFRYVSEPDKNLASARNKGIRMARGEYVAFLDADDVALPGKVGALVGALEGDRGALGAVGNTILVDDEGRAWKRIRPTTRSLTVKALFWENTVGNGAAVFRNVPALEFAEEVGYLEDQLTWMRLREKYRLVPMDVDCYRWSYGSDGARLTNKYCHGDELVFVRGLFLRGVRERHRARLSRHEAPTLSKGVGTALGALFALNSSRAGGGIGGPPQEVDPPTLDGGSA